MNWNYIVDLLPDDETTILVAHGDGEVSEGFVDGNHWTYQHAPGADPVEIANVYAWADMPTAPERR